MYRNAPSQLSTVSHVEYAISHLEMPDHLMVAVSEILVTPDDHIAFITCDHSDEIGVLDLHTGKLLDLLTHESPIKNFSVSHKGDYVFVSLEQGKPNAFNKLWHVPSRQILYEFGRVPAYSVALQKEDTVFFLQQEDRSLKEPFRITQLKLSGESFGEYKLEQEVKFVLQDPFVTPDDKYLVIVTADGYDEYNALHVNPSICAVALTAGLPVSTYGIGVLSDNVKISRILQVRPIPSNPYNVLLLFTPEPDRTHQHGHTYNHCYGLMIFDLCSGIICHVLENFISPVTPLDCVLFTDDVSVCLT